MSSARFWMNVNKRPMAERMEEREGGHQGAASFLLSQSQVTALNAMRKEMPPPTIEVQYGNVTFMRRSLVEITSVAFPEVEFIMLGALDRWRSVGNGPVSVELIVIEETRVGPAINRSVKRRKTLAGSGMIGKEGGAAFWRT